MRTYPAGRQDADATTLAQLTTMRIGGAIDTFVQAHTQSEVVETVKQADTTNTPLLVIGGGSNILASDDAFHGVVLRDMRTDITLAEADGTAEVTVQAGRGWDEFVAWSVENGYSGIEMLSGVPGTVGAAPVQNIGAYGGDISQRCVSLHAYNRATGEICTLSAQDMAFGYRTSLLKQSARDFGGYTPQYVVLDVTFRLDITPMSAPIAYSQLASRLGVEAGECAPARDVREAVLDVRASKGMVLDDTDRDTYSCGSFFTNPILTPEQAAQLPPDAPRFSAGSTNAVGAAAPEEGMVKTSAAWLIDHAGFPAGYAQPAPAALSSKHCLALTNRGGATGAQMRALAQEIIDGVRAAFGVELVPEPILL